MSSAALIISLNCLTSPVGMMTLVALEFFIKGGAKVHETWLPMTWSWGREGFFVNVGENRRMMFDGGFVLWVGLKCVVVYIEREKSQRRNKSISIWHIHVVVVVNYIVCWRVWRWLDETSECALVSKKAVRRNILQCLFGVHQIGRYNTLIQWLRFSQTPVGSTFVFFSKTINFF